MSGLIPLILALQSGLQGPPPDKLPIGAFFKSFTIVKGPSYEVNSEDGWSDQGHWSADHPGWTYVLNIDEASFCSRMKHVLTKRDGWTISFSKDLGALSVEGYHETKGHRDWQIGSDDAADVQGPMHGKGKTILMMTDYTRTLARHHGSRTTPPTSKN